MTPQERQLVDDLFERLARLENAPRDPDAAAAVAQGLRNAPNAVYALVQTVLVQDEALKRANSRIQDLEAAASAPQQSQSGGFLDSMRDAILGPGASRGSVPNVHPPQPTSRPVWNSGQVLQQTSPPGSYDQGHYSQGYNQGYNQGYGNQGPGGSLFGGGGSSFLGTAAAAAAGMVGGSLLLNGIRSMMGGPHFGAAAPAIIEENVASPATGPWVDQSDSQLARDAGINDIGGSDTTSNAGLLDQASYDDGRDDMTNDDMTDDDTANMDAGNDDFDGDDGNGSDYA